VRSEIVGVVVFSLLGFGWGHARAAVVASDVASNLAYAAETGGAWKGTSPSAGENPAGMDDGGLGFQPWSFAGGFHYPAQSPYGSLNHFIDGVDLTHSAFNQLSAPAFGLTNANLAFGGSTTRATRVLDTPLGVGGTVSLDFDNPELRPFDPFAPSGFVIRLNAGGGPVTQIGVTERFGFFTTFGFNGGNWSVTDSAGLTDSGLSSEETTTGATLRFTLSGAETYTLSISSLGGGTPVLTHSGSLANAASGPIDSIEVLMFENGSGNGISGPAAQPTGEREFFFNNLQVESNETGSNGDFDRDGDTDGADFLLWQGTLGSTTILAADSNGNGAVDGQDLNAWKATFGAISPTAIAHSSAVSEPRASIALIAVAILLLEMSKCLRVRSNQEMAVIATSWSTLLPTSADSAFPRRSDAARRNWPRPCVDHRWSL
jgi:hypothetical protein